jgi:hypothetical protein
MAGARIIVNGPDFTALPFGLWDSIQQRDDTDPHWQNGITWQDFCPNTSGMSMYEECITVTGAGNAAPPPMPTLTPNVTRTDRGATPFSVYAEYDGSPIGLDYSRIDAEQALPRVEKFHVEHAFWTGLAANQPTVWPHLAANAVLVDPLNITLQPTASPVVTGGAGAARALGALEDQLANCYTGQGYIHVTPSVLNALVNAYIIDMDASVRDGKLYTPRGNIVVVGGGYTGSSPAGAAPAAGTSWMYATGAVFGYRSQAYVRQMPEDFDRVKNTVKLLAYRTYLIGFECCLIAALVNLPT